MPRFNVRKLEQNFSLKAWCQQQAERYVESIFTSFHPATWKIFLMFFSSQTILSFCSFVLLFLAVILIIISFIIIRMNGMKSFVKSVLCCEIRVSFFSWKCSSRILLINLSKLDNKKSKLTHLIVWVCENHDYLD